MKQAQLYSVVKELRLNKFQSKKVCGIMFNIKCVVCFLFCVGANCQSETNKNVTEGSEIDGQTLYEFGRKYNKPIFTAVGLAILNLHPCAEWTQWSNCSALSAGFFGIRTRTRKCGKYEESKKDSSSSIKTDYGFCEGRCRSGYNFTTNGFCMKLYIEKRNNANAESQCISDGGHLINIDTAKKYGDVKTMLTGFTLNINIGGRRKDASSSWEYSYGSQAGFFSWYSGYPTSNLCLALSNPRLFYDHSCSVQYPFICEIPQEL